MKSRRGGRPGQWRALAPGRLVTGTILTLAAVAAMTGFAATASAAPAAGPATVTVTSHFVWRPDSGDTSGDSAFISNGATNGQKKDLLFVMPNLTPGGISPCPCLLSSVPPVGVWYNGSQWAIFNEDSSTMGTLFGYNVLVVPKAGKAAFRMQATASNTHGDYVIINSPLANGHPGALIQVTQNFGQAAVYNPTRSASATSRSGAAGRSSTRTAPPCRAMPRSTC